MGRTHLSCCAETKEHRMDLEQTGSAGLPPVHYTESKPFIVISGDNSFPGPVLLLGVKEEEKVFSGSTEY